MLFCLARDRQGSLKDVSLLAFSVFFALVACRVKMRESLISTLGQLNDPPNNCRRPQLHMGCNGSSDVRVFLAFVGLNRVNIDLPTF